MTDSISLPYRKGVGMMLMNRDRKIFVARRLDTTAEAWQMPQGGIDEGESPVAAAMRELEEETGTGKASLIAESQDWYSYDLPTYLIPKIWGGRYRGQTQKWFLLQFEGTDSDINIQTEHPEFSEWKWTEANQLPDLIVPFKKQLYEQLVREFHSYL